MKKKVIALVMAQMLVINCAALPVFAGQEGTVGANSIRPAASNQAEESVVSPDEMEEDAEGSFVTGQEELLLGLPVAADVRECGDEGAFAQALADLNMDYPCDFDGEIVIDTEKDILTNERGEEMVGADQFVTEALLSDDPEKAAEILKENGYGDVLVEDGMVRVSDRYDTGRIFVTSSEPVDTRGALSAIRFGETYLLQYASSGEAAIAAGMLENAPGVASVSPDYVMRQSVIISEPVPTDDIQDDAPSEEEPSVGRFFTDATSYKSAAVSYMGINRFLANTGTVNTATTVAVIDSGYDTSCSHVDYSRIRLDAANCLAGREMRDVVGHGTFVMNQIYEATDSAVTLVPYKISDDKSGYYSASLMLAAIYRAVEGGADFINLSSGSDVAYYEEFLQGEAALQYALDRGCYVITAAGNESRNVNYLWPAKSSRCITVTSISYVTGQLADYANFGDAVDFAAPGGTEDAMLRGYSSGNRYVGMGGTSMAVPYYTAALADLKANGRAFADISDLRRALSGYCEAELTAFASSYYVGYGCVNLANAIDRAITADCIGQIGSYAYTGTAVRPNPAVTYSGTRLQMNRDYVVSYSNNVNPGQARVTVSGRGVYKGTAYKEFTIVPKSLSGASVTTKYTHYDYTGSARRPAVTVTLDGKVLTNGADYSLSYADNKNPGLATITVTGTGCYSGTAKGTFQIGRRVASVTSGYAYVLVPKAATGRSVALKNGGMANNTALWVNTRTSAEAQQFRILYSGNGTYRIANRNSGKVLMPTKSTAAPGAAVVQGVWSGAACQQWRVVEKSEGAFALKNCAGYYLEMGGSTAKNGVRLRLNEYVSTKRMMWVRF